MKSSKGWIRLHRQLQDCWLWNDEPYSKGQAWVDLLLSANHDDKKIYVNGQLKIIRRGQMLTSIYKLADRWQWSRSKVRRFLNILEIDKMITLECNKGGTSNGTTLTIVKYADYQYSGTTDDTTDDTTVELRSNINNNDKELNNNNYIVEIVNYLNQKCGTKYKASTANTKKHISARLNDGYKYEDFVKVIDKKYQEWKGTEWEQYLRPDTLFGTKFESYLNQNIVRNSKQTQFHHSEQNTYDYADIEKKLLGG